MVPKTPMLSSAPAHASRYSLDFEPTNKNNRPSFVLSDTSGAIQSSPPNTMMMMDNKCRGKLFVLGIIFTVITIGVIMGVVLAIAID